MVECFTCFSSPAFIVVSLGFLAHFVAFRFNVAQSLRLASTRCCFRLALDVDTAVRFMWRWFIIKCSQEKQEHGGVGRKWALGPAMVEDHGKSHLGMFD